MDPGMDKMMQLAKMQRLNARLPPPEDVSRAINIFVAHGLKTKAAIEDTQAQYLIQAIEYLQQQPTSTNELISNANVKSLLLMMCRVPRAPSSLHHRLALCLENVIHQRDIQQGKPNRIIYEVVEALCSTGASVLARDLFLERYRDMTSSGVDYGKIQWKRILRGLDEEGNLQEMIRTLDVMTEHNVYITRGVCSIMTTAYASRGDTKSANHWYGRMRDSTTEPDAKPKKQSHERLLKACLSTKQFELGQSVVRDITIAGPSKFEWDLIFEWAAGTGKGVDEIDRMMGVMERANQGSADNQPDIETINRLVELAISRNDSYMAERFIGLGKKRNIQPNAKTLVLQMEYRLSVNDVDGALTAYKYLQGQDLSENEDTSTVNRLLCAMCASGRQDFDTIMNVAADLSDRSARFEPATVCALAVLHLSRDELHDVVDLLNTHVYRYSIVEKATVRDTFINYCLNRSTTTTQAWQAYPIFRQTFDETPREQRTQIMDEFFRRRRPDMAVHVFNDMRMHTREDTIPTVETYVSCFAGIARLKDIESLDVVHNQLKLDYSIEQSTHLLNSLIVAYTACEEPRRALTFWDEIVSSREGPTLSSIHLAFRACEVSPWGDQKAHEIWARLERTNMDLDQPLWASYAAGLVGNGDVIGAIGTMEKAHDEGRVQLDAFL